MTAYDDLFAETAPTDSVFADKSALDPLAEPDEIVARESQEREIASLIQGIHEGYLPQTVSIYGPPGTGKTLTTRRVCQAFADCTPEVAVEYVNLKECRSLFAAANEIHLELTGERLGAYQGLDGVFTGIWNALADYPEWTVLLLDEIDHVQQDSNYDPSDFFYRLLRGEGKRQRDIDLSAWLLSNEVVQVDLGLDSRVQSAIAGRPSASRRTDELDAILRPRVDAAFAENAVTDTAFEYGVREAARRWGDARQALTLFRQAGETANDQGRETVTEECVAAALDATEQEAITETLLELPFNHFLVLVASTSHTHGDDATIVQPVTTSDIVAILDTDAIDDDLQLGARAVRDVVRDLETMNLVETWIESRGREGRVKQIQTTFDPTWVRAAMEPYLEGTDQVDIAALQPDTQTEDA